MKASRNSVTRFWTNTGITVAGKKIIMLCRTDLEIESNACRQIRSYRRPTILLHLPKARGHLPQAARLQPSHYFYQDNQKAQCCGLDGFESNSKGRAGCWPASIGRSKYGATMVQQGLTYMKYELTQKGIFPTYVSVEGRTMPGCV